MQVILHIGDSKTGSTAIQYALSRREDALRDRGILCPGVLYGHNSLPRLVGAADRHDDAASLDKARRTMEVLRAAAADTPSATMLLSSERFFDLSVADVRGLVRRIAGTVSDLKVVCYVRRPEEQYLSWVQQELKADTRFTAPDAFTRPFERVFADWRAVPECSDLVVRAFDRDRLEGGSVVRDFERVVGRWLSAPLELEDASRNTSLSAEQMVLMQRVRGFDGFTQGRFHPASEALLRFLENLNRLAAPVGGKPRLRDAARAAVTRANASALRALERQYPGLLPPPAEELTGAFSGASDGSVAAILDGVDEDTLRDLSALVPYAPDGRFIPFRYPAFEALNRLCARFGLPPEQAFDTYAAYRQRAPQLKFPRPEPAIRVLRAERKAETARADAAERAAAQLEARLGEVEAALQQARGFPWRHALKSLRRRDS